jgi:cell division protein FtsB
MNMNLNGEFITHKVFGKGQIIEFQDSYVTVQFSETNEKKKFIYPSAIETFLFLENAGTAQEFRDYLTEISRNSAMARQDEEDRLNAEKLAIKEHAKKLKKAAAKKPVKKPAKSFVEITEEPTY